MLFTFIRAVAKQCKTKLLVRCFPQFGHSTKEQLPTKHTVSVRTTHQKLAAKSMAELFPLHQGPLKSCDMDI
jgi:hypothetical protein